MTCENKNKEPLDTATAVVIAANRLDEVGKADPGSDRHVDAMRELLECLQRPGALGMLLYVVPKVARNGQTKIT